jgi:hypothetical protein
MKANDIAIANKRCIYVRCGTVAPGFYCGSRRRGERLAVQVRRLPRPDSDGWWVEGQNIVVEYRFAEGRLDRLPDLAAELDRGRGHGESRGEGRGKWASSGEPQLKRRAKSYSRVGAPRSPSQ